MHRFKYLFVFGFLSLLGSLATAQTEISVQDWKECESSGLFTKKVRSLGIPCELLKKSAFPIDVDTRNAGKQLQLKYLGCGGFYIGDEIRGVLIDPFFSQYSIWEVATKQIEPIDADIEKGLMSIRQDLHDKTEAIITAHAHYDHLMDAPTILKRYLDSSRSRQPFIYTSETGAKILSTQLDSSSIKSIPKPTGNGQIMDTLYLNDKSIRVIPVSTNHAPHAVGITLAASQLKPKHLRKFSGNDKSRFWWWKEGSNYAFIIDFLDQNQAIEFRIYHQSSASAGKGGHLPEEALDTEAEQIDLLILGAASYDKVKNYPDSLYKNLNSPKRLVLCHWEDFFQPYGSEAKMVTLTPVDKLICHIHENLLKWKKNEAQQLFVPEPGVEFQIMY
ncbi:MAG: hypothetical protein R8G66_31260 [Cytophagales bacterium]|nr:hypothetical protein [Cytophagales bacterium]